MHRGKVARAQQARELDCIALVGFYALAGFARNQRRCTHHALEALGRKPALQAVAAGARLIDDLDVPGLGLQALAQAVDFDLSGGEDTSAPIAKPTAPIVS